MRGAGLYDYDASGARTGLWPGLATVFPAHGDPAGVDLRELTERLLFVEAVAAARCVAEGVLTSTADANIGSLLGLPRLRERASFTGWLAEVRGTAPEPLPRVDPGTAAQIQYTSGTTGTPKGAVLHHRGLVTNATFVAARAGFPRDGVWGSALPLFHTAGCDLTVLGTGPDDSAHDKPHTTGRPLWQVEVKIVGRVRQAAVPGLSDPPWGEQVAAVINANDPADPPTAAELHDHLRAALAPHKTPRHWYLADAIPANAMGKMQKFLLRRQISDGNLKPLP
ncbi:AMP-binding protein [Streptomyces sp. NPDC002845]